MKKFYFLIVVLGIGFYASAQHAKHSSKRHSKKALTGTIFDWQISTDQFNRMQAYETGCSGDSCHEERGVKYANTIFKNRIKKFYGITTEGGSSPFQYVQGRYTKQDEMNYARVHGLRFTSGAARVAGYHTQIIQIYLTSAVKKYVVKTHEKFLTGSHVYFIVHRICPPPEGSCMIENHLDNTALAVR